MAAFGSSRQRTLATNFDCICRYPGADLICVVTQWFTDILVSDTSILLRSSSNYLVLTFLFVYKKEKIEVHFYDAYV